MITNDEARAVWTILRSMSGPVNDALAAHGAVPVACALFDMHSRIMHQIGMSAEAYHALLGSLAQHTAEQWALFDGQARSDLHSPRTTVH